MNMTKIHLPAALLMIGLMSGGSAMAADGDSSIPLVTAETKLPLVQWADGEVKPKARIPREKSSPSETGPAGGADRVGVKGNRGTGRRAGAEGAVLVLVRRGDCLSKIAEALGVPLEALESANGITPATEDRIRAGGMLIVPVGKMTVETKGGAASVSAPLTVAKSGGLRAD